MNQDSFVAQAQRGRIITLEQITFSSSRALSQLQDVLYITERCVFRLSPAGLVLSEVAPGIDVDKQILSLLPFDVIVDDPVPMRQSLFTPGLTGLRDRITAVRMEDRLHFDSTSNTVFMDYSGLHVRTEADVEEAVAAVDALLEPLSRRVRAIVNYDRFLLDENVVDAWADAVKYVVERYYLGVSRHATSGFTRLKLSKEFAKRNIESSLEEKPSRSTPEL